MTCHGHRNAIAVQLGCGSQTGNMGGVVVRDGHEKRGVLTCSDVLGWWICLALFQL